MKFIVSTLDGASAVEKLHPLFPKAFAFLRRADLATLAPGRYELEGDRCYAMVSDSPLKPVSEGRLELHRRYIDIQSPLGGVETIGIGPVPPSVTPGQFDAGKDCVFFDGTFGLVDLRPGEFAVLYPLEDAHAPCLSHAGAQPPQRKVVIKVLAEAL